MDQARYLWRQLGPEQRERLLAWRQQQKRPWHSPPHRESEHLHFHVSAACYEHQPWIGHSAERMQAFAQELLATPRHTLESVVVWCLLPNHYHLLVATPDILGYLQVLGRLHGRTAFYWNGEEHQRGRKVWCNVVERALRSERHFWATVNYIHHNPVHHGYALRWEDWPFSSAGDYLAAMGRHRAAHTWREYPILDYGKGWDDPEM